MASAVAIRSSERRVISPGSPGPAPTRWTMPLTGPTLSRARRGRRALGAQANARGLVGELAGHGGGALVSGAGLESEAALSGGGHELGQRHAAVLEPEALEPGACEHDRFEVAVFEAPQPRVHVAAQLPHVE